MKVSQKKSKLKPKHREQIREVISKMQIETLPFVVKFNQKVAN